MTDQIPAGLTRAEAQAVREWAERARNAQVQDGTVAHAARVLLAVLPKLPTLADMSPEERSACQWFQADVETWGRAVIIAPNASDRRAMTLNRRGYVAYEDHDSVTPRPDLPRMTWPGDTPAPAVPALPEGWRLADHPAYGRVIVTNPTTNRDGRVYFVSPAPSPIGNDWHFCTPGQLTYLDQEDDTADTVPESTLAVGSKWNNSVALTRACEESERDQIVVLDANDYAYTWAYDAEWWEGSAPPIDPPYTIIHTGRKADQ